MKTLFTSALITLTLFAGMQGAQAADVGGNVKTSVKAGVILQSNKGIANKNTITLGSVKGKNTSIGGNFKSRVKVGAIIQTNTGIANKNSVSIGSVQ